MAWIKRNLLLVVGSVLAAGLLGFGLFYFWTNRQKNKEIETQLEENKNTLKGLIDDDPYPSRTNITRAKEELERVKVAIEGAKLFFQPVPFDPVTGQAFKSLLDQTLFDLHGKAAAASVGLPGEGRGYAFTFAHQKTQLQFPPEAFPALPQQLAEIQAICETLFDAKINKLVALRRSRLYSEEPVSQVDHHELKPRVDETMGMASNPYEVVFHAFTPELAATLQSFYTSTNGMIVKGITVEPAPSAEPDPNQPRPPVAQPRVVRPGTPGAVKPQEGVKTVLNEKLLKITMLLDVVRTTALATNSTGKNITWNR